MEKNKALATRFHSILVPAVVVFAHRKVLRNMHAYMLHFYRKVGSMLAMLRDVGLNALDVVEAELCWRLIS